MFLGFPGDSDSEESACNVGDLSSPWVGKIPWRRAWKPTLVFLPKNPHGQTSLAGYRGHKESDKTEQLSTHICPTLTLSSHATFPVATSGGENYQEHTQGIHAQRRTGNLSWLKESLERWTKNDSHEGYSLEALYPQPHSSLPVCFLWSASCWNSWSEPQPHVVSGREGQPKLGSACSFWQWHKELGPPRKQGGSGSPWKEIQKCWGTETKFSVSKEASQTDQVGPL